MFNNKLVILVGLLVVIFQGYQGFPQQYLLNRQYLDRSHHPSEDLPRRGPRPVEEELDAVIQSTYRHEHDEYSPKHKADYDNVSRKRFTDGSWSQEDSSLSRANDGSSRSVQPESSRERQSVRDGAVVMQGSARVKISEHQSNNIEAVWCKLPECFLPGSGVPGGLSTSSTPQLVFFTFDDAITPANKDFYDRLFTSSRTNPNGCPIRATFMNSHNYTVYNLLQDLHLKGHELASHSVTHRLPTTWWQHATEREYQDEIVGQRNNLHQLGGVPLEAVHGMRVPFLQMGSDNQFTMLQHNRFTYDSSMVARVEPPSWPFTLHQPNLITPQLCTNGHCPERPYDVWELPLNILYMKTDGEVTCQAAMVDGCRPTTKQQALDYLKENFERHYASETRPPFGINMHSAWFAFPNTFSAMQEFVDDVLQNTDVWIVTAYNVIRWIRNPTPLDKLKDFTPFACH